jgi:hypothetical protein
MGRGNFSSAKRMSVYRSVEKSLSVSPARSISRSKRSPIFSSSRPELSLSIDAMASTRSSPRFGRPQIIAGDAASKGILSARTTAAARSRCRDPEAPRGSRIRIGDRVAFSFSSTKYKPNRLVRQVSVNRVPMYARACSVMRTPRSPINFLNDGWLSRPSTNTTSLAPISRRTRRSVSRIVTVSLAERRDLAGLSQHLVDLVEMHFLEEDHFARVFFKRNVGSFAQSQELVICIQRRFFLL